VLFVEKSRRIGLTWGLAAYAVLRAGRAKEAGGMDAMYISYSQEMTREFIDACAMWARAYRLGRDSQEEFLFDDTDPAHPARDAPDPGVPHPLRFRLRDPRRSRRRRAPARQAGPGHHRRGRLRRQPQGAAQGGAGLPDVGRPGRGLLDPQRRRQRIQRLVQDILGGARSITSGSISTRRC
jgi:hypothetical protein